jgi:hypothetical protein
MCCTKDYGRKCPHFIWKEDGKSFCLIYDERDKFCNKCGISHQRCIDYPVEGVHIKLPMECGFKWQ